MFPDFRAKPDCSRFSHNRNKVDFLVHHIQRQRQLLKGGLLIAVRKCQPANRGDRRIERQVEDTVKHRSPEPGWDYLTEGQTSPQATHALRASVGSARGTQPMFCNPDTSIVGYIRDVLSELFLKAARDVVHFRNAWTSHLISLNLAVLSVKQGSLILRDKE